MRFFLYKTELNTGNSKLTIKWTATVFCLLSIGIFQFNTLNAQTTCFNWENLGFTDEEAIPSGTTFIQDGVTVTVTWSTVTDGGTFVAASGNDFVSFEAGTQGTDTGVMSMGFNNSENDPDDKIIATISFSQPVTGVAFSMNDIDGDATDDWADGIEVFFDTGSGNQNVKGTAYWTIPSGSTTVVVDDETYMDGFEAINVSAENNTVDGNVDFDLSTETVTSFTVEYFSTDDAKADPNNQLIALSDFCFDTPSNVIANDDNSSTDIEVSVVVNVSANDHPGLTSFNFSSVSNSGLLQATNGSLSINSSNGEITYTPNSQFVGQDSFEYQICNTDSPTPACDTATVYVTVSCPGTPGQNIIEGTVFEDLDNNGNLNGGETGPINVDVKIYEDNSPIGTLDGSDVLTTTVQTDANGDFSYSPSLSGPTQTFSVQVSIGDDDAEEPSGGGTVDVSSTDLELINDSGDQIVGMRFQGITIPQGANITNAYVEFETDETSTGLTNLDFYGEDIDDAPTFSTTSGNITGRTKTTASVAWDNVPEWNTTSEKHQSPDISTIIQEIVDRGGWSSGNDLVILVEGDGSRTAESYNGETAAAPLLYIEYNIENFPAYFIMEIDVNDIPAGAVMTTDNVETASFTATGQTDCANNFGFVTDADLSLTKAANMANVNVGDTVTYTLKLFNDGPSGATGVTVSDTLDANLTYVSSNGEGTYDSGTHLWTVPTVPNGDSATINILATVDVAGAILNKAEVYASDLNDPDSTPDNSNASEDDQSSVTVTGVLPDISITKIVDNATPNVGDAITFTITANNIGLGDATGIQVTDMLPSEFTYVSDDSGGNYNTGSGVWTAGDLVSMASTTLNITVIPNKVGTPTNTAQLTSIDQTDSNAGNDQGSVLVTIDCTVIKASMTLIKN